MNLQVLEEFIQKDGQRTSVSSKYTPFFVELEKTEIGKVVSCEPIMDKTRTVAHNKTNISSCAGKWAAKNEVKAKFAFLIGTVKRPKMQEVEGKPVPVMEEVEGKQVPVMEDVEVLAAKRIS